MSELPVVAVITAKEGSVDVTRDALTALVAPTRAEEGCLSYELYESAAVPGVFVTIESWRSQADVDAHLGSEHVAAALTAASEALAVPPAIHPLTAVES